MVSSFFLFPFAMICGKKKIGPELLYSWEDRMPEFEWNAKGGGVNRTPVGEYGLCGPGIHISQWQAG